VTASSHGALARRAVIFGAARVAGAASIIALFVLLSRLLETEEYGSFRQVWLLNKGLLEVLGCGIPLSLYYLVPKLAEPQRRTLIHQSQILLAGLGIALCAALFLGAEALGRAFGNPVLPALLRCFALYPLFALPVTVAESAMLSLGHSTEISAFLLIDRIGFVLTAAAAVLIGGSLHGLFLALVGFGVLELAASLWMIERALRPLPSAPPQWRFAEQLRFSLPSGFAMMVDVINVEVDKLITAAFLSVARFAHYANGAFEVPIFGVLVGSVSAVMMPEYASRQRAGDRAGVLALWHEALERTALVLVPASVYLSVFAPDLISLLFSERYADSALIFRIYLLGLLPKLAWYGPTLVSLGANRAPLYGSLLAVSCNAALSYLLLQWLDWIGPALAGVLTGHLLLLYYLRLLGRRLDVPSHRVLPLAALARILGVSLAAGLLCWPATRLPWLGHIGPPALGALLFSGAAGLLFWWTGLLRLSDLRALVLRAPGSGLPAREAETS
jgi:O-antigen/teichoic acid export membrane protein